MTNGGAVRGPYKRIYNRILSAEKRGIYLSRFLEQYQQLVYAYTLFSYEKRNDSNEYMLVY